MTKDQEGRGDQDYELQACSPSDLTAEELAACINIVKQGDAVDPESAAAELPKAQLLAVVRLKSAVVGVGAVKRIRTAYSSGISGKSGVPFPPNTPELGYVAVDSGHRGRGLSGRIVAGLLSKTNGRLFATTSDEWMKKTLAGAGFLQKGRQWKRQEKDGRLSLWVKGSST